MIRARRSHQRRLNKIYDNNVMDKNELDENPFFKCVSEKTKSLEKKHAEFLIENHLTLQNATIICFEYKPNGRISYKRITNYNPEIDKEIENILDTCAEKFLIKK